jgi:hypothetical protein
MKQNFQIFSFLLICLCAVSGVFAQQKVDLSRELDDLQQKAQEMRRNKSYRIKTTIEEYDETGKKLKSKSVSVSETAPPDRSYDSSTTESAGVTKKVERIEIGDKSYIKKDGGKWRKSVPEQSSSVIGVGLSTGVKIVEETMINGQSVKVYMEETRASLGGEDFSSTDKYWFTSEGELLKTESERKNGKTGEISRVVTVYEFDPNIRIEAPIK